MLSFHAFAHIQIIITISAGPSPTTPINADAEEYAETHCDPTQAPNRVADVGYAYKVQGIGITM
jgi:hypothetical protein